MSVDEQEIERKFQRFSGRLHQAWKRRYAVTDAELQAVRQAVKEQWRLEQGTVIRTAGTDQTTKPVDPNAQKQAEGMQDQQRKRAEVERQRKRKGQRRQL